MIIRDSTLLKMEGRSGCKLEVLNRDGVLSVRKISKEPAYNVRLLRQGVKQHQFLINVVSGMFKTPAVLEQSDAHELLAWFEMSYLHGQKYSEFFERASIPEIRNLAQKFERHFAEALLQSRIEGVDVTVFTSKLESVCALLYDRMDIDQQIVKNAAEYLLRVPSDRMPVGSCHGDFTFSNMLFCEDGIYLVDFLDSFIESPLIDLVKFRQDTFFHWSLLIENQLPSSRSAKIIQVFNYLDTYVFEALAGNPFVKVWYTYLQVFNLLRILPYVSERREIEFVQKNLYRLIPIA
jgi:hypothetical protein